MYFFNLVVFILTVQNMILKLLSFKPGNSLREAKNVAAILLEKGRSD